MLDIKTFAKWENKQYKQNDIVVYNNDIYISNKDNVSAINNIDWIKITNRIEPNIKNFIPNFEYNANDIIVYEDNIYRAKNITKKASFDLTDWILLTRSEKTNIPIWQNNKNYQQGEIVKSDTDNIFYYINKTHTSDSINKDIEKQNLIGLLTIENFKNRSYSVGEIIYYNGKLYRAKNIVVAKIEFDYSEWELIVEPTAIQDWKANTVYHKDTIIVIDGISYQVAANFTSGNSFENEFNSVKPQYASIIDWKQDTKYQKGVTVIYNEKLYQCSITHTSSTSFEKDKWNLIAAFSTTTIIENFETTKNYQQGEIVFYNNRLYRATMPIAKSNTFQPQWELITMDSFAPTWVENKTYQKDMIVFYSGVLYRAKSTTSSETFKEDEWERLFQNVLLSDWKENVLYQKGDIVVYNGQIWKAGVKHQSTTDFESNNWESLSNSGGGNLAGWKQITRLNTNAGTKVRITFPETLTFCFPPIDVLMLQSGASNVLVNSYTFDVGDGNRFEYDKNKVVYDGTVHCNTNINITMTDQIALGSGFMCVSDEIDLTGYNSIDGVYV